MFKAVCLSQFSSFVLSVVCFVYLFCAFVLTNSVDLVITQFLISIFTQYHNKLHKNHKIVNNPLDTNFYIAVSIRHKNGLLCKAPRTLQLHVFQGKLSFVTFSQQQP